MSGVSATRSYNSHTTTTTTSVQYETLTLVPGKSSEYLYAMPSMAANKTTISGIIAVTSWAVVVEPSAPPSVASSTAISNSSSTIASTSTTTTTSPDTSTNSTSTAPGLIVNPISSTTASVLCFDSDLEKDVPCSASSTSVTTTSGVAGYNPAGATTIGSGSRIKMVNGVWIYVFLGLVLLQREWW
ncbi:hypothetical protein MMC34_001881 [Xylographa carneopallida]|nr:hypothetical protein [Xylographa carneopallida]